jgi:hypothetical protein
MRALYINKILINKCDILQKSNFTFNYDRIIAYLRNNDN